MTTYSHRHSLQALLLTCLIPLLAGPCIADAASSAPLPDAYNIVWDSPGKHSADSMPCGGGDIGLNVWVENGDVLFYIQRSGSLAETNEYLKLGRVRLQLDPNPFAEGFSTFRQELKLREGLVEIRGSTADGQKNPIDVTVRLWVEVQRPIIHVEVDASQPVHATASYENWRFEDEMMPRVTPHDDRRRSFITLLQYPGEVKLGRDQVEHAAGGVLFYHRNPGEATLPEMLIEQQGLGAFKDEIADDLRNRTFGGLMIGGGFRKTGVSEGKYQTLPFKAWNLASEKPARRHHLRVVTHIDQAESVKDWQQGLMGTVKASTDDLEESRRATLAWWADFWNRSWIVIHPDNPDPSNKAWRVGRNYNLFRYQLGCNAFGEYPSKFNGGNFTYDANLVGSRGKSFGPDWRNWGGGVFTAQNQRLLHWPMLKAGDFDAILPQFELYRKALPGARARVRAHFDHDGAVYSEYIGVPGLALAMGWGWESGSRARGEELPFGDPRADATRGYNDLVEKGVMANGAIGYHWESQLEHAYMMLEYRRFTGADLTDYMPFIEHALVFFDEHYRKREKMRSGRELDPDGRLVIYPAKACETYRGATNPSDLIAGLQACLEAILELDDNKLKLRDKAYYRAFLDSLPPFTYAETKGDRVIQPAASWKVYRNAELPQFYPLFPFNRFDLLGSERDHLDVFRNTYKHGTFRKGNVISWHQDGIFFARMGQTAEAADFNTRKLDDSPRRFPTFWGPGHDWVPDHNWGGSGMIGLQEMLLQTVGDTIRLLPAWPKDWDADFKLHAPHQTTVEGRVREGKLIDLKVTPESRRKDVVIANDFEPFKEAEHNSRLVREGYERCHRYVDAWLKAALDKSGPVNTMLLSEMAVGKRNRDIWSPRNAAADNYAFMVLSTSFTDPESYQGIMKTILENERKYASLPDGMPVTYNIKQDKQIGTADVFGASEYVKDGLMAITEWMGTDNPWFDRMVQIQTLMWSKYATVKTAAGEWMISGNVEVNGEQLQMLPRLYWVTGDRKWLEYAIRIADHYLLGDGNHPTDDFNTLRFRDHGNEIMGGLTELYATLTYTDPDKARAYKAQLHKIYDRALEVGRNEDGFFYNVVNPVSGTVTNKGLADTFGYVLNGYYTLYMIDGKAEYRDATRQVLENIHPKYLNNDFGERMDGRADAAEGVMNLYNREPVKSAALWVDDTMQDLWSQQKANGLIDGTYPDGNFARTTIMYCLWKSQGITIEPYEKNVAYGAVERDGVIYLSVSSTQDYEGRLVFDHPRSKRMMRMPLDWPRINQFPEWFTVKADAHYLVQEMMTGTKKSYTGKAMHAGLPVSLKAGVVQQIRIEQK